MTNIRNPRHYWQMHTDAALIQARDEYRANPEVGGWLLDVADDIDDELERRREYRQRFTGGAA